MALLIGLEPIMIRYECIVLPIRTKAALFDIWYNNSKDHRLYPPDIEKCPSKLSSIIHVIYKK